MPDLSLLRRALAASAFGLVAACGWIDPHAGGTIGTEAGNAVTARLRLPDGSPAAGARVVVRPWDAIDSSSQDHWTSQTADSQGVVSLRLAAGASWTLEARMGSLAWRSDFSSGEKDISLPGNLGPSNPLSGTVLGELSGVRLYLPGLAISTLLDARGRFELPGIPPGIQRLQAGDRSWTLPDTLRQNLVLFADGTGKVLQEGMAFVLPALPIPVRLRVPDSLAPSNHSILLDGQGQKVPFVSSPSRNGFHQIWAGPAPQGAQVFAAVAGPATTLSPFSSAQGMRLAWIPELGGTDQVAGSGGIRFDTTVASDSDGTEGRFARIPLGLKMGTIPAKTLPDTGDFSIVFRARLLSPSVGSLWLLEWMDSTRSSGIHIGIGAGRLRLQAGTLDTSIYLADPIDWTNLALVGNGHILSAWANGIQLLRIESSAFGARTWWREPAIGVGGAMGIGAVLAWDRAIDAKAATTPPEATR